MGKGVAVDMDHTYVCMYVHVLYNYSLAGFDPKVKSRQ